MRDLVIIDNSVIDALINDMHFASQVPCFANPAPMSVASISNPGCGYCGGNTGLDYNAIKNCIGMLDSTKLNILKRRLDAKRIRIFRQVDKNGRIEGLKHTR